jgi:hypothetical protein
LNGSEKVKPRDRNCRAYYPGCTPTTVAEK